MPLLRAVLDVNAGQPKQLLALIARHHPSLQNVPVTVLGLAFKPDTDDLRESPAFPVIRELGAAGANVTAYDPVARPVGHPQLAGVRLADDLEDALRSAAVVVLVTKWREFDAVPALLSRLGQSPLLVDGRRIFAKESVPSYEGIGWRRRSDSEART
jgi:UDPglucose 6-dehydrogenase/GDP-mannose 6-dehydrogenase